MTATPTLAPPAAAALRELLHRHHHDLPDTDPDRILALVESGRTARAGRAELTELAIAAAAGLTAEEPAYAKLAARLLAGRIADETAAQGIDSFSASVATAYAEGLLDPGFAGFVAAHADALDGLVDHAHDGAFEYFGLRTLHDRYLLRHPGSRAVLERPQHFWLRVATGLSDTVEEAGELYRALARLAYLPSSPTLFNAGARHQQLSSCFLVDSPRDELESIYERYTQVAKLSKFAGGIGISWSRVRSRGSLIRGTNGRSNGIVPWLRTLDASVAAVNQGGRRKGAACVYLDTWHADIEEFLELRDNTGDDARRTHNLNLANWVPDEFMRRVEADADWSLFDPKEVPELIDLWGAEFDAAYRAAEAAGRAVRTLPARTLYARMMRTLAQTGNGWMTFKDAANRTCNQVGNGGGVVHHSNLCTEILEVTSDDETAVCTLGSINLAAHLSADGVDFAALGATVRLAVGALDRAIDRNWFPTGQAATAHRRWRPLGLGVMGLADVFAALRLAFDSPEARALSTRIAEEIALAAYDASADLAAARGAHPAYPLTRAAGGVLHPDHWPDARPARPEAWAALRAKIARHGLRNSLLVAIAPTATIASIAGCAECVEPLVSNVFKRETLSGEFLQVNRYLVADLKRLGRWTPQTRDAIKQADGSVQGLDLPAELKALYRTAWELPQKALIDLAAARAPYVDQSQSLNLFQAAPTIGRLSSMYAYAWRAGLKTTYYLRSRPATRIAQTTVRKGTFLTPPVEQGPPVNNSVAPVAGDGDAVACSLENPEVCEACQ
ncbi:MULTISPECIES: ribonucleoside-diphosphate reductase subunit alpha [Micromonospora]|uniref:Ribonucleoside-diphosphate reductase n=1 Tax=Micromonospora solifontis TaxID=2487138 RepID=A0ABX9WAE8_9ACTN|nr:MULTISPECIES: ribonucleoside-diphosphate reductase subunit alpha [Micromonospora]NES15736.1 ribonucleoside-diphosphate reductase subunit alpha [Micromonospora sp. PPF5-17B]NES39008.1 ribonucleoside-diphosphate reductase subunit alpha [Micromonospora solifontis]NES56582.1 ribonucleoside-diphosphate reductase subunit alpha [Micromonospora sp. PPF5-6]RNL91975.1 ribonucleoside-diphosphate reductase subunit alpha [Micromonospora solifontis]